MKIKDLPADTNLGDIKVKTPNGITGTWKSQWDKGVWLTPENPATPGQVIPVFVADLKETLEWEVVDISLHKR